MLAVSLEPGSRCRAAGYGPHTHQLFLRRVKRIAAFSVSLRTNLVSMLDGIGIPAALSLRTSSVGWYRVIAVFDRLQPPNALCNVDSNTLKGQVMTLGNQRVEAIYVVS
jgi:hypothetical protein